MCDLTTAAVCVSRLRRQQLSSYTPSRPVTPLPQRTAPLGGSGGGARRPLIGWRPAAIFGAVPTLGAEAAAQQSVQQTDKGDRRVRTCPAGRVCVCVCVESLRDQDKGQERGGWLKQCDSL